MSETPFFSVIVPACNVAPYAEEMIASIQKQTLPDFEALIVCEESSDDTWRVIEAAIAGDARFQMVPLPRSGSASVSRNYGIEHARGDYLVFVDGDDWIEPDSLRCFQKCLLEYDMPDLLEAGFRTWAERGGAVVGPACCYAGPLPGTEALALEFTDGSYCSATWRRIYRRKFLTDNALFQVPGRKHQDDEWTPRVVFAARSVVYIPFSYYNYRKREHSITSSRSADSLRSVTENFGSFCNFWRTHTIPPELRRPLARWYCGFLSNYFAPFAVRLFEQELRRREFLALMRANGRMYAQIACAAKVSDRIFMLFAAMPLWLLQGRAMAWGEWCYFRIFYRAM